MRFMTYCDREGEGEGVALSVDGAYRGLPVSQLKSDLMGLLGDGGDDLRQAADVLRRAPVVEMKAVTRLPPIPRPGKIICIGLNYAEHSRESGFEPPAYPAVFARYASSLVAHEAPIVRPRESEQLDFEGELAVIVGRAGRRIAESDALDHVAGYCLFNDASIRDFQMKSTQWTMGKTFDGTGSFGPDLVTPDELPPGAKGLRLETRLNGQTVQSANTDDLIFPVPSLIALLSEAMTLSPGDLIVTGTPSGIGATRKPPLWMKSGDRCEIEMEGVGVLSNPVVEG
jgi:2-keto-4-pentenoate hydratase/2-oxohepta-3-ene-1,7-dioic acid hydratase in catechol pathway